MNALEKVRLEERIFHALRDSILLLLENRLCAPGYNFKPCRQRIVNFYIQALVV